MAERLVNGQAVRESTAFYNQQQRIDIFIQSHSRVAGIEALRTTETGAVVDGRFISGVVKAMADEQKLGRSLAVDLDTHFPGHQSQGAILAACRGQDLPIGEIAEYVRHVLGAQYSDQSIRALIAQIIQNSRLTETIEAIEREEPFPVFRLDRYTGFTVEGREKLLYRTNNKPGVKQFDIKRILRVFSPSGSRLVSVT